MRTHRTMLCRWTMAIALVALAACRSTPAADQPVTLAMDLTGTPPVTGANVLNVEVKTADGTPVTDAMVTGELFMPVMESMGRTAVKFTPAGAGRYTGQGNLTMAGSWQIAVTASRGGKVVATRTFNITTRS